MMTEQELHDEFRLLTRSVLQDSKNNDFRHVQIQGFPAGRDIATTGFNRNVFKL